MPSFITCAFVVCKVRVGRASILLESQSSGVRVLEATEMAHVLCYPPWLVHMYTHMHMHKLSLHTYTACVACTVDWEIFIVKNISSVPLM